MLVVYCCLLCSLSCSFYKIHTHTPRDGETQTHTGAKTHALRISISALARAPQRRYRIMCRELKRIHRAQVTLPYLLRAAGRAVFVAGPVASFAVVSAQAMLAKQFPFVSLCTGARMQMPTIK